MYHVYLLRSEKDKSFYVGYTSDIERRLRDHNSGSVGYTKQRKPWKLVYYETFADIEDARLREERLKVFGKAFGQLKQRIKKSLNI